MYALIKSINYTIKLFSPNSLHNKIMVNIHLNGKFLLINWANQDVDLFTTQLNAYSIGVCACIELLSLFQPISWGYR
jgi:hypothetical protein